jgi:hypothetical protein
MRLLALLGLLMAASPVSIHLSKTVLMVGQGFSLTCTVAQDPRNRRLVFGIENLTQSERQLDGSSAPRTWGPFDYPHIPCDVDTAYCAVIRSDGTLDRALQSFLVSGCLGH